VLGDALEGQDIRYPLGVIPHWSGISWEITDEVGAHHPCVATYAAGGGSFANIPEQTIVAEHVHG
jgi:hypothetical protein